MEEKDCNIPFYYVNQVDIHHSGSDFLFQMGISSPSSVSVQFKMYMSPQQSKGLLNGLNEAVQSFEDKCGIINMPELEEVKKELD